MNKQETTSPIGQRERTNATPHSLGLKSPPNGHPRPWAEPGVLVELRARDVRVWADGDHLRCDAPAGVLTPDVQEELRQHKREILEFLRAPAELSYPQQRLWFLDQVEPGGTAYIMTRAFELRGNLDVPALERAFEALVRRHESLRTVFVHMEEQLFQVVLESGPWALPVEDLGGQPDAHSTLMTRLRAAATHPFDLANGPLFRAQLYGIAADTHVLMLTMHHIILDGWSEGILIRELGELYNAFLRGHPTALPPLRFQYRDFARWQRQHWQDGALAESLAHWKSRLAGAPQVLELPTDHPRPPVERHRGTIQVFTLPAELVKDLRSLARLEHATLFMTLASGFTLLLARYSGQDDLLLGTPVANRNRAEFENAIGFFANTVVLRADLSGNPSVRQHLARMREVCLDAVAHQELPLDRLVEEIQPRRDPGRNPLFQVMFAQQSGPQDALELDGLTTSPLCVHAGGALFDLAVLVDETPGELRAYFEYATDLFEEQTIARMAGHWRALLEAMVACPDRSVWELPMLTDPERTQLLMDWNQTTVADPRQNLCLHQLFEAQAARTPDQPAVAFEDQRLTYAELNHRADQLARHLRTLGAGPEVLVGLCVERSVELVVGLLGILKAGAAYVPIDTALPAERIALMLADAGVELLVTQTSLLPGLPSDCRSVCLDEIWTAPAKRSGDGALTSTEHRSAKKQGGVAATPTNAAYVIFTSGSTGRPKGVCIEHRNIVNYVLGIVERLRLTPGMQHAMVSTIAADLGNTVLFPALITGGCLHIISHERAESPAQLSEYFAREQIDVLKIVPSHLAALQSGRNPESIMPRQRLILGGEASRLEWIKQLRDWSPGCEIYNHYGPTETTVGVLTYRVGADFPLTPSGTLPLGRPLPNSRVYLLDRHGQPVPRGVTGELCIGGAGVARGYLNRPELNAEKFTPDPFHPGSRLYRTGDRARYLPDGNLEFCGRLDHQIKIHGYRIEPGEIEAVLREHPGVREAVVLGREEESSGKQLVAYLVPTRPAQPLWEGRAIHLLPDGSPVAHLNKHETDYIYHEIFVLQAYLRHGITIRDGDVIVDAGANIGLFTVFASRLARSLRVLAFEPNPAAFACLKANAEAYGAAAKCLPFGLSSEERTAELTFFEGFSLLSGFYADAAIEREVVKTYALNQMSGSPDNGQLAGAVEEIIEDRFRARTETTQLRTLSNVITAEGVERIDLLKINVEKSELDVLRGIGAGDWAKIRQLVVEVDQAKDRAPLMALLEQQGYEVLLEQDPLLTKTDLCYVYAIRPSPAGRLVREQADGAHLRSVPPTPEILTPVALRKHLQARLPQYMIPSAFVLLEQFPLTANGKLDRQALPAPTSPSRSPAREISRLPTETEQTLVRIFSEVLNVEHVGLDDDFFDLGGHSLLAIKTLARIRDAFNVDLPTRTLFEKPVLADLAGAIDALQWLRLSNTPAGEETGIQEEVVL
ncbi:MAG: amino acid adenylation domain-containing protein [Verrucomicrobiota bacterium]